MTSNVSKLSTPEQYPIQTPTGGNGNGKDTHARISVIEAELKHLATKEDIQEIKTLIASTESRTQRWLIGILLTALVTVSVALFRTFWST
ncbi:MAG: hypothetical protein OXC62_01405 [Aestuariivita sp.]|nr:hypothetical protein [Aestuariivita sp.]